MGGSEFVFDNIDIFYYKLHNISLNRDGSFSKMVEKQAINNKS